jgi:hypothetical protein
LEYRKILLTHKGRLHAVLTALSSKGEDVEPIRQRIEAMFLKKVDGPRSVTLADGSMMSQADLPNPKTRRWVASRKAAVVRGVLYGLISQAEAQTRYAISEDEFLEWVRAVTEHGEGALKATRVQKNRQL